MSGYPTLSSEKNYLREKGFNDVYKTFEISIDTHPTLKKINLFHEPNCCVKDSPIVKFNLFGHIHGRQMIKRYGLDVGVDAHDFRPISKDEVEFWMNAIKNHYDEEVFS